MQQSNFIFGMILLAFIVFITTRGELPAYISLLRGGTASGDTGGASGAAADSATSSGNIGQTLTKGAMSLDNAKKLLDLFGG